MARLDEQYKGFCGYQPDGPGCQSSAATVYGSIGGIVTDQTGSVIPDAKLTLTNTAQGVPYRTATDSNGGYSFLSSR